MPTTSKRNADQPLVALMDCLSAGYLLEPSSKDWLRGVVEAVVPALDDGLGVLGYTYDATDPRKPVITGFATAAGFDPRWLGPFNEAVKSAEGNSSESLHPAGFDAWQGLTCGQASRVTGMKKIVPLFAHLGSAKDTFAINARDSSGNGFWLGSPLRSTTPASARRITVFSRLAAHLSSAMRLRHAATSEPAAVLSPGGKLLHAPDPVAATERAQLREATLAFDSARSKRLRADIDEATRRWRPLVESRWSLLDEFDTDGRRFVVAVQNTPPTPALPKELSDREAQVLTHAKLGHSNKVIAYELGLSASTVRVLLHRASRKLGVNNRKDTIAQFEGLTAREPAKQ
ncbi:MAG: hypothetical protein DI536_21455 [Archangium gephyra]|uniref:HTH luxR-type domain-containing protein n=1 Tax=Archangium gephyra TaxID=48 RepID=A0A2W5T360_9BACT|nr:MAG: hypothetical protein DI536_21455 [Archangium gephyra]